MSIDSYLIEAEKDEAVRLEQENELKKYGTREWEKVLGDGAEASTYSRRYGQLPTTANHDAVSFSIDSSALGKMLRGDKSVSVTATTSGQEHLNVEKINTDRQQVLGEKLKVFNSELEEARKNPRNWTQWFAERYPFVPADKAMQVAREEAIANIKRSPETALDSEWAELARLAALEEYTANRSGAGTALDIATSIPSIVAEFAVTGGAYGGGKAIVSKGAKAIGMSERAAGMAEATLGRAAGVGAQALGQTGGLGRQIAGQMESHVRTNGKDTLGVLRPEEMQDIEQLISTSDNSFGEAVAKGLLSHYIEVGSERTGGVVSKVLGAAGSKLASKSMGKAISTPVRISQAAFKGIRRRMLTELAAKYGGLAKLKEVAEKGNWDNLIGEWMEERFGDAARGFTQFGPEATRLDEGFGLIGKVASGDFQGAFEQGAIEAGAFLAPSAANLAAGTAARGALKGAAVAGERVEAKRFYNDPTYARDYAENAPAESLDKLVNAGENPSRKTFAELGLPRMATAKERKAFRDNVMTFYGGESPAAATPPGKSTGAKAGAPPVVAPQPTPTPGIDLGEPQSTPATQPTPKPVPGPLDESGKDVTTSGGTVLKQPGPPDIDMTEAKRFVDANGGDAKPLQDHVKQLVQSQRAKGFKAIYEFLTPDGMLDKAVEIDDNIRDAKGQTWGTMWLLNGSARIRFEPADAKADAPAAPPVEEPVSDLLRQGRKATINALVKARRKGEDFAPFTKSWPTLSDKGKQGLIDQMIEGDVLPATFKEKANPSAQDVIEAIDTKLKPPAQTTETDRKPPQTEPDPTPEPAKPPKSTGVKKQPRPSVTLQSGRSIEIPDFGAADTDRKAANGIKRLDQWLVATAQEDAKEAGNDFLVTQFQGLDGSKLTPADRDNLNEYLFGHPSGVNLLTGQRIAPPDQISTYQPPPKPLLKPLSEPAAEPEKSTGVKTPAKPPKATMSDEDLEALVDDVWGDKKPATPETPAKPQVRSYKIDVKVDGKWGNFNAVRYPTEEAAKAGGADLLSRWMLAEDFRVVESEDSPNRTEKAEPKDESKSPDRQLADDVTRMLSDGKRVSKEDLFEAADKRYGGTRAEAKYGQSEAYDAMETGVHRHIAEGGVYAKNAAPEEAIEALEKLLGYLPSQTNRTGEKDRLQQFSTPPHYSYVAAWAANIDKGDVVFEPSAGTGSLLSHAINAGAKEVWANEYSDRRADLLQSFPEIKGVSKNDAEHIHMMPPKGMGQPSVILMNPPFSRSVHDPSGKKHIGTDLKHISSALKLLAPGGRLVAIAGAPLKEGQETQTFAKWLRDLQAEGDVTVRAHIKLARGEYAKYGTTFPTRFLIIDKAPGLGETVTGNAANLTELVSLVKDIRDGRKRTGTESTPAGATVPEAPSAGGGSGKSPGTVQRPASDVGAGGKSGGDVRGGKRGGGTSAKPPADSGATGGKTGDSAKPPVNQPSGARGGKTSAPGAPGNDAAPGGQGAGGQSLHEPDRSGSGPVNDAAAKLQAARDAARKAFEASKPQERDDGVAGMADESPSKANIRQFLDMVRLYNDAGMTSFKDVVADLSATFGKEEVSYRSQILERAWNLVRERYDDRLDEATDVDAILESQPEQAPPEPPKKDEPPPERKADETPPPTDEEPEDPNSFAKYRPPVGGSAKGLQPHKAEIVESLAMASVDSPPVTYVPNLPKSIIESGALSDVQYAAVALAGQSHEQMFTDQRGTPVRRAFLLGDGTGLGKTRALLGVVIDNMRRGRKKAIVLSKNDDLFRDLQSEWKALDQDPKKLHKIATVAKDGKPIVIKDGIVYLSYTALGKASKGKKRLDSLVDWVGDKFDGVIVMDEAHGMKNSSPNAGGGGGRRQAASLRGIAGVDLQARLPNARIIYASATAATEVENMGYMHRLGLWGAGRAFTDVSDFVSRIKTAGLAGMEQVAKDLKVMGLYAARSIAFRGPTPETTVTYDRLEHPLSEDQIAAYDKMAEGWQVALRNINAAIGMTNGGSQQRTAALSAFYSSMQRFFDQVLVSFQAPAAIRAMEKDLKEGRSVVIQLTSTGDAAADRIITKDGKKAGDANATYDDEDMSPLELLKTMIENAFPTIQYVDSTDDNGNPVKVVLNDEHGNPVHNPQALAAKQKLLDDLGSLLGSSVPQDTPLDMLVRHFGPNGIAEMTSRKKRFVYNDKGSRILQKYPDSAKNVALQKFNDGEIRVLVFSEAGGTGKSYHASLDQKNQEKRAHYLFQAGWKADVAMQGLGRAHRTNQKYAPHIVLVHTDLPGQKRFLSTIARRLGQLGALTRGQRGAAASVFTEADNLESTQAKVAKDVFLASVADGSIEEIDPHVFQEMTGIRLFDSNGQPITNFRTSVQMGRLLNRLLALPVGFQRTVFRNFEQVHAYVVDQARKRGELDLGMQLYKGKEIIKEQETEVHRDAESGGTAKYVKFSATEPIKVVQFYELSKGDNDYIVERNGKLWHASPTGQMEQNPRTGNLSPRIHMTGVVKDSAKYSSQEKIDKGYTRVPWDEAEKKWNAAVSATPKTRRRKFHILSGMLLPIWGRMVREGGFYRVVTEKGEAFLGKEIPKDRLQAQLSRLGVTEEQERLTPEQMVQRVLSGQGEITLANGWVIGRSKVQGEQRLEITGPQYNHRIWLTGLGVTEERIQSRTRWFIPVGDQAATIVGEIIKTHPPVSSQSYDDEDSDDDGIAGFVGGKSAQGMPKIPGKAGPSPKKVYSKQAIVARLYKDLVLPLRTGRVQMAKAFATYNYYTKIARQTNQAIAQLAVQIHEAAHHLDNISDVLKKAPKAAVNEIRPLDYLPTRKNKKINAQEGFAEFVRIWMTMDGTSQASDKVAKGFHAYFEKWLDDNPEYGKILRNGKRLVDIWRRAEAMQKAQQGFSDSGLPARPAEETLIERAKVVLEEAFDTLYFRFVDSTWPLQKAAAAAVKAGYKLPPGMSSAAQLALAYSMAAPQHAYRAIQDGVHSVSANHRMFGPGLAEYLKEINEGEDYAEFRAFAHARHTVELHAKKPQYNSGMDIDVAQAVLAGIKKESQKKYDRFERAAQGLTQFNNDLILMLADAGVLTAQQAQDIIKEYDTYIPLERAKLSGLTQGGEALLYLPVIGEVAQKLGSHTKAGAVAKYVKDTATVRNPVRGRSAKGSGEQVLDPIDSTLRRAQRFYAAAMRQQVQEQLVRELDPQLGAKGHKGAKGLGNIAEYVKPLTTKTEISVGSILSQLVQHDIIDQQRADDLIQNEPEKLLAVLQIFGRDYSPDKEHHIIRVLVDGHPRMYQLNKYVHEALQEMDPPQAGMFVRVFAAAVRGIELGAVALNPRFGVANPIRDWQAYQKNTKYAGAESIGSPIYWMGKYVANAATAAANGQEDDMIKLWMEMSGHVVSRLGYSNRSIRAARREILGKKQKSLGRKALNRAKTPVDTVRNMIGVTEVGPRLAEFAAALRDSGYYYNPSTGTLVDAQGNGARPTREALVKAILAANDVTLNYKRRGRWGRKWSSFIPFFNAWLQGHDKTIRIYRDLVKTKDPALKKRLLQRFLISHAAMVSAAALYFLLRGDDDELVEQEAWENNYFNFAITDTIKLRIPKGFEETMIYNTTEAIMRAAFGKDEERREGWKDMLLAYFQRAEMPVNVALITPVLENLQDRDWFFETPIEGEGMQDVGTMYRYDENTTALAKYLSRFALGSEGESGFSPKEIDFLLNRYTGGGYDRLMRTGDSLGRLTGLREGDMSWQDIPGAKSLLMPRRGRGKSVGEFYEAWKDAEMRVNNNDHNKTPNAEDTHRRNMLRRYRQFMDAVSDSLPEDATPEQRIANQRMITGLARSAIGLGQMASYPDPLKMTAEQRAALPEATRKALESEIGKIIYMATQSPEPDREHKEAIEAYQARVAADPNLSQAFSDRQAELRLGQEMLAAATLTQAEKLAIFERHWTEDRHHKTHLWSKSQSKWKLNPPWAERRAQLTIVNE